MRKSSSDSSRGPRPSAGKSSSGSRPGFNKEQGSGPFKKSARPPKKNYDGRSPSGAGEGSPRAKPYSGRTTDSDRPARPFEKSGFGKETRHGGGKEEEERRPRKDAPRSARPAGKDRPFSERPKRQPQEGDRPFGNRDARDGDRGERKPKSGDRPFQKSDRPFGNRDARDGDRGERKSKSGDRPFQKSDRPSGDRPKRPTDKAGFGDRSGSSRPTGDDNTGKSGRIQDSRPFRQRPRPATGRAEFDKKDTDRKDRTDKEATRENKPASFKDFVDKAFTGGDSKVKKNPDEDYPGKRQQFEDKVYGELEDASAEDKPKKPYEKKLSLAPGKKRFVHDHSEGRKKKYKDDEDEDDEDKEDKEDKEISQKGGPRLEMPLNKFIAHSGECSRRDAAELVRQGKVKVNGELVLDPGYRVQHDDKVTMSGKKLTPQKGMVYILLNKPKGFITTNDDPQGRRTVMDLVGNSGVDRLFPVGRLDRDTSGLLLITNDGDLTQKLCHPAYNIKKVYQVTLDKPLTKADFDKITEGVELEDGKAPVDALAYLEKKNELGLEIHSGRNRIVRRIFESLGYVVEKLDRVMYAGLTKKNLPRSKWRYLDEREVVLLKHFKN